MASPTDPQTTTGTTVNYISIIYEGNTYKYTKIYQDIPIYTKFIA